MTFLKQQLICSLSQRTRCSNLSLKRKTNLHLPFLTFWKRWKSADIFCSTFKKICKIFLKILMQRKQWWEKKLWTIKIKIVHFVFWQGIAKRTFFFSFLFRRTDVRGCIGWTFIYRYDQCLKKKADSAIFNTFYRLWKLNYVGETHNLSSKDIWFIWLSVVLFI